MISVGTAILLTSFGGLFMLAGIVAGIVLHLRWIDKKLSKPQPKPVAPTPGNGASK